MLMMEITWFYFPFVLSVFVLLVSKFILKQTPKSKQPPRPPSLPIIGHLHLIKEPVHRTLQHLSTKYGPIFSLSFGFRPVLVISSPTLVEECFTKNDIILANRPRFLSSKYLNYDSTTIGSAPYGHHWRNLRRIASLEIFSTNKLNMFLSIRQDEVRNLLRNLFKVSYQEETEVQMRSRLSEMSFNMIMRMISGKRYFGIEVDDFEEARGFREMIKEAFELSGEVYPGDFLPFFRWLDFQRFEKRMMKLQNKADAILQSLIDEQRTKRIGFGQQGGKIKTTIQTLLSLQESDPESYSDVIIKGLVVALLGAGTDTSSITIEWALSILLNHPTVLNKARAEIDDVVGHNRLVDEPDLARLPYLQCIINETLRLFPPAPIIPAHESSQNCTIGGYNITRGTILLVNTWAIHRDPELWDDSTSFRPERFEGILEGEGCKFIPFGMGRRGCPGAGLAHRVVGLALASLIQCFDWERVGQEEVDLAEGTGLTMPKAKPLIAMCKPRKSMFNILAEL
ncbi:Cytochrome P450 [Corchorus olitorius]|uniref:Cytochrome P450 n=1 Tax=Corchorus olitorius TaxID=93759 RepID=A0A1R3HJX4_9ROSI|nr:Cytochrome P450 [Corchorus olitorius]